MRSSSGPLRRLTGALVLLVAVTSACHVADDPCKPGTHRCVGDELQSCTTHSGGVLGPVDSPTYDKGSDPTWEKAETCGANLCVTTARSSFCALESTPRPACTEAFLCDGGDVLRCHEGYVVGTQRCLSCEPSRLDPCVGGVGAACTADTGCGDGLFCDPSRKTCEMRCACAEGEACASCNVLDAHTGVEGVPPAWVCASGLCRMK